MNLVRETSLEHLLPEMKRAIPVIEEIFSINGLIPIAIYQTIKMRTLPTYDKEGLAINLKVPTIRKEMIKLGLECRLGSKYKVTYYSKSLRIIYTDNINKRRS